MKNVAISDKFGVKFAEAVGISIQNLAGFCMICDAHSAVVIKATYYVENEAIEKTFQLVEHYKAVEVVNVNNHQ